MSQADAFVCTSDQDCNAKLQEYLRWKKPVLAYDGEANNFFRNGENALLAKDGDYAPLVMRLADDPALCRRLAEAAARDIPVMSWKEIAVLFDEFFSGLDDRPAGASAPNVDSHRKAKMKLRAERSWERK